MYISSLLQAEVGALISPESPFSLPTGIKFPNLPLPVCDNILNDLKQQIDSKTNEIKLKKTEIQNLQEKVDGFLLLCD